MNDKDLKKRAADICYPMFKGNLCVNTFDPLANANHTKMLKDRAVELGLCVTIRIDGRSDVGMVTVFNDDLPIVTKPIVSKDIENQVVTLALVDAIEGRE